jgi:FixJ family two-component response regulator
LGTRQAPDEAAPVVASPRPGPLFESNIEVACLPKRNLVFVVDDDAMMLKSVARLLRQFGYESVLFPSAEAFANHRDFDGVICILLDIDLGDVSGIALRHRLKEANISVPVIYITGTTAQPFVRLRVNPGASPI